MVVVKPLGPHHSFMCSGRVKASNTSSRGASSSRVKVSSRPRTVARSVLSVAAIFLLLLALHPVQVVLEPVQALFPEAAVVLDPVRHLAQRAGLQPAGPPLGLAAARDEPRLLQHLQ